MLCSDYIFVLQNPCGCVTSKEKNVLNCEKMEKEMSSASSFVYYRNILEIAVWKEKPNVISDN